ncbi:flagellar hook-basal body complex protein, partial [bacterium]
MAVNVNVWNLMYSMRSVSRWQDTIQSNINGALRNGYKEADIVFGGNATYDAVSPTQTMLGKQIGEQAISVASTRNLWKQGNIIPTKSLTDFAVNGEGFFMVYDPKDSKTYYTRDGSFRPNHTGQLTNAEGLILVDAALAINLGNTVIPFTPTAPTNDQVINNETNWQPLANVGGNLTAPWWLGNANATFGDDYTVQVKKTFFAQGNLLTGAETMNISADNVAHVFVNGVQVTPPAGVSGWAGNGGPITLNIGPYLKDGANTIFIQAANSPFPGADPAGILTSGTVAGVNLNSDPSWAVRAAETRTLQAPIIEDTYT